LVLNGWLMPHLAPAGETTMVAAKITPLGANWSETAQLLGSAPWSLVARIWARMFDGASVGYLAGIFVPFIPLIGVARRADLYPLGVAVLLSLLNLLINPEHTLLSHYQLVLTPFLFSFAVSALPRLVSKLGLGRAAVLLLLCSWVTYDGSPPAIARSYTALPGQERLSEVLAMIPATASVCSQNSLLPQLSRRRDARIFTTPAALPAFPGVPGFPRFKDEYVVLSTLPGLSQWGYDHLSQDMGQIEARGYRLIAQAGPTRLWLREKAAP
jgi:hypothetical protein